MIGKLTVPTRYVKRARSILNRLPVGRVVLVAELGVWDGVLAATLLTMRRDLVYVGIDRWTTVPEDHRYSKHGGPCAPGNLRRHCEAYANARQITEHARPRAVLIQGETTEMGYYLKGNLFDFVFVDADHSYEGCKNDLHAWWPLVRDGCWMGGHDYGQKDFGVQPAVDEFFTGREIVLEADDCWFVRK